MQPVFLILMEKDYVNKKPLLKPKIYSSKLLIMNNTIKVTFDNSRNIFSLNETKNSKKRVFDLKFKNFFGLSAPSIFKI